MMPALVYLYTSSGSRKSDTIPDWDRSAPTNDRFALRAPSDGMVKLMAELAEQSVVEHTTVLLDSVRSSGKLQLSPKAELYAVPNINCALEFIRPGDIVIVRGGFRVWLPLLNLLHEQHQNWLLFYRANTAHGHWPFWDVILDDLIDKSVRHRGRLHFAFSKPVNEDVFGPIDAPGVLPKIYDVMIGASHIHRKKGQYRVVEALHEFYHMFHYLPSAILPGGYLRCQTNDIILDLIKHGEVHITGPIHLTRQQLALAMNQTKLFVHAGVGGQNDRGVLEAQCCGVETIIASPKRFSPFIGRNSTIWDSGDTKQLAREIHACLELQKIEKLPYEYPQQNGMREVALPKMIRLLTWLVANPVDRTNACLEFANA